MTSKERAFIVESIEIRMNFMPQSADEVKTAALIVARLHREMLLDSGLQITRGNGIKKGKKNGLVPFLPPVNWDEELKKLGKQK